MTPLPSAVADLLRRPNPAVVATTRQDGRPVSAAVWYLWDGEEVLLSMGVTSPRRRQLERDGRLSLTVLDSATWYRQVTLHCDLIEVRDDPGFEAIDRLSEHYEGVPYPARDTAHAAARLRPVEWNQFGLEVD